MKRFKPYYFGVHVKPDDSKLKSAKNVLYSSYSFHSMNEVENWLETEFVQLKKTYDTLVYSVFDLPGLKVGEKCRVNGDGADVYKIIGVDERMKNRPLFVLDSGFVEEVQKCFETV